MTVKSLLESIKTIDSNINIMLENLTMLRELAAKATSVISAAPGGTNKGSSRLEETVVKIINTENQINGEIDRLVDRRNVVLALTQKLDNGDEQRIIHLRYMRYNSWREIADETNWSLRQVHRLHDRALVKLEKIYAAK